MDHPPQKVGVEISKLNMDYHSESSGPFSIDTEYFESRHMEEQGEEVENRIKTFKRQRREYKNKLPEELYAVPEEKWYEIIKEEQENFGPFGERRKEELQKRRNKLIKEYKEDQQLLWDCVVEIANEGDIKEDAAAFGSERRCQKLGSLFTKMEQENILKDEPASLQTLKNIKPKWDRLSEKLNREIRRAEYPVSERDVLGHSLELFIEIFLDETEKSHIGLGKAIYERFCQWRAECQEMKGTIRSQLIEEIKVEKDFYSAMKKRGFNTTRTGQPSNQVKIIGVNIKELRE